MHTHIDIGAFVFNGKNCFSMYEACTLAACSLHYIAVALTILPVATIEGAVSAR